MTLERLSSDQFISLANAAGLPLTGDVLDALDKRGLLTSWVNEEYGIPHLFVVALYFESIRVYRHPWAVVSSDVKLEVVKTCNRTTQALGPKLAIENDKISTEVETLARGVEGFMNRIDPFGPVAGIIDFMRVDVREKLTGVGRLYVEIRRFAVLISEAIERVEGIEEHQQQQTVVEAEKVRQSNQDSGAVETISPAQQTREIQTYNEPEVPLPEEESISSEPTDDVTIEEPSPLLAPNRDALEKKIEEVKSDPAAITSERDGPMYRTARTQDLLSRLKNLKTDDDGDLDPKDLEAQIGELNRQREALMASQNWEGLVALYESKIELFPSPLEKQQVFLTLAQIQEVKLKDPQRAFELFQLTIEIAEGDEALTGGIEKGYAGLQRVGSRDALLDGLVNWLEQRIADGCQPFERALLQHTYSSALREAGEKQRAFLTYAAFLTEKPEEFVDVQTLEGLEDFASEVEDTELESFFQDLLEQDAPDEVQVLVATRAGLFYASRNPMIAVRYFRLALKHNPTADVAYNNLSHIYQEEKNWADLVELATARLDAVPPPERKQLSLQIAAFVEQDIEDSDDAFDRYRGAAEADPDSTAIDWAIRAFIKTNRFTEAYAFLNRILDKIEHLPRRVLVLKTLAEIAMDHLSAPEEAVLHYQSGLEVAGPRRDLLEGLASIRIEAGSWTEAVVVLDSLTGGEVALPEDARLHWLVKGVQVAEQAAKTDAVTLFKTRIATIDGNHELLR